MATNSSDYQLFYKKRAYSKLNISPEQKINLIILAHIT